MIHCAQCHGIVGQWGKIQDIFVGKLGNGVFDLSDGRISEVCWQRHPRYGFGMSGKVPFVLPVSATSLAVYEGAGTRPTMWRNRSTLSDSFSMCVRRSSKD
jgi:hypothetical protein